MAQPLSKAIENSVMHDGFGGHPMFMGSRTVNVGSRSESSGVLQRRNSLRPGLRNVREIGRSVSPVDEGSNVEAQLAQRRPSSPGVAPAVTLLGPGLRPYALR